MGLDVSVYQNIKVRDLEDEDDYDYEFQAFVPAPQWEHKIKNLNNGAYYTGDSVGDLRSGYGSHYGFRVALCEIMYRTENEWIHGELNENMPFYELIDFSDCEGCLDWEISEKLYNDFISNHEAAMRYFKVKPNFKDKYIEWTEIFRLGKDKGVVSFG